MNVLFEQGGPASTMQVGKFTNAINQEMKKRGVDGMKLAARQAIPMGRAHRGDAQSTTVTRSILCRPAAGLVRDRYLIAVLIEADNFRGGPDTAVEEIVVRRSHYCQRKVAGAGDVMKRRRSGEREGGFRIESQDQWTFEAPEYHNVSTNERPILGPRDPFDFSTS